MAEQTALELIAEASELLSKIHPDLLSIIKTLPEPSLVTFSQLVPITSKQTVFVKPLLNVSKVEVFSGQNFRRLARCSQQQWLLMAFVGAADDGKEEGDEKSCGKSLEKATSLLAGVLPKLPILAGVAKTAGNNEGFAKTAGNTEAACNHVRMLDQALNYLETGSGFTNLSMENAIVEIFVMISPAHFSKIQIALEILTGTHSSPKYASKNAALVGQSAEGSTAKSFFESLASSSSSIKRGTSWPSCGASSSTGQTNLRESRYSSEFGLWPWQRGHGRRLRRHRWQRMGTDIVDSSASGLAEKGLGKAEKGKKVKTKKWRKKKCELRSRVKNVKLRSANIEKLGISRRERY
ncbi:hypothetical protein V8G54_031616 [Vigna mungo]|uniref:Uncharacterized protein n=1 Tax=Vigna mungo TaxID=3915 RepID=A0AAQ3MKR1_VIGMU